MPQIGIGKPLSAWLTFDKDLMSSMTARVMWSRVTATTAFHLLPWPSVEHGEANDSLVKQFRGAGCSLGVQAALVATTWHLMGTSGVVSILV